MAQPVVFESLPAGFQRDGTVFSGTGYVDGQWTRWHMGRPRKMGGYQAASVTPAALVREIHASWDTNSLGYVHTMMQAGVARTTVDATGTWTAFVDRTPVGFTNNVNNNWQVDELYDTASSKNTLVLHCTNSLADIGAGVSQPVYYGDQYAVTAFTTTSKSVNGGIVVLQPYLFGYDADGTISWTVANKPADWTNTGSGSARVAGAKIVRGLPVRGAANGPAGMFWSLNEMILCRFVGGTPIFSFQTITTKSSVLSSRGIVEYDGKFYWPGLKRFLMYDGTFKELQNTQTLNTFFDNLNFAQRQKVFGVVNPAYGEIWWGYPSTNSTECDRVMIYNVRQNCWYDSEISRSAGFHSSVYLYPLLTDSGATPYVWQHELGYDKVIGLTTTSIPSYLETSPFSLSQADGGQDPNFWYGLMYLDRVEPDFTQTGDLELTGISRKYARSNDVTIGALTITSTTERLDPRWQGRQMRLRITSDVVGGYWEGGRTLLGLKPGDGQ